MLEQIMLENKAGLDNARGVTRTGYERQGMESREYERQGMENVAGTRTPMPHHVVRAWWRDHGHKAGPKQ